MRLNNNTILSLCLIAVAATTMFGAEAFAGAAGVGASGKEGKVDAVSGAICSVVKTLQGPIAKGVAAFGIIFLGFSLFLGKISWGTGIALAIGLGAVLGAGQIVNVISGEEACK